MHFSVPYCQGLRLSLTGLAFVLIGAAAPARAAPDQGEVNPALWPDLSPAFAEDAQIEVNVSALLRKMTLAEKVGQIIQADLGSVTPEQVRDYHLGSVLNGADTGPGRDPRASGPAWLALADRLWAASTDPRHKRAAVPVLWGTDAVHGHNNVVGATIFPHNIGLGATRDPDLVRRIAKATAEEMKATQVRWNFAPAVSHPRDIRWGRTYEGYAQDAEIITALGEAYVEGLVEVGALPSVKHFVADGGTSWGSSTRVSAENMALLDNDPTLALSKVGDWMFQYLQLGAWKLDQELCRQCRTCMQLRFHRGCWQTGSPSHSPSYCGRLACRVHSRRLPGCSIRTPSCFHMNWGSESHRGPCLN